MGKNCEYDNHLKLFLEIYSYTWCIERSLKGEYKDESENGYVTKVSRT